jgi:hypothetical protein
MKRAGPFKTLVHMICAKLNGVTAKETDLFTVERTYIDWDSVFDF